MKEPLKRFVKSLIPWRLRYFIKLQEAKGNLRIAGSIKQHRPLKEYNDALYQALEELSVSDIRDCTVCEMGPGEYLSHALMEYRMGVRKEYLLEIGDFVGLEKRVDIDSQKIEANERFIRQLPPVKQDDTWRDYLSRINAVYSENGLAGYETIPDQTVDYVVSFAVLEHIRKKEFQKTMREVFRFMKPGALAYHNVDYMDHMGGKKNQLRFPEAVWEDSDHYKMDMYTNRICLSEMLDLLKDIGFHVLKVRKQKYQKSPISRKRLDPVFRGISEDDLMTAKAGIILQKPDT